MKTFVMLLVAVLLTACTTRADRKPGLCYEACTTGARLEGGRTYHCDAGPCTTTADYINGGGTVLTGTLTVEEK